MILDGEVTRVGTSEARRRYHVFDILWLDGRDLTSLPLDARRALLHGAALSRAASTVTPLEESEPWERACAEGWEGVIAKRRDSPYEHRRSPHWLKMKCEASQELVVGGFTDPQGARVGLGALLVGYFEGDDFVFAGKVGTGFDTKLLLELRARLDALEIPKPPFTKAVGCRACARTGCARRSSCRWRSSNGPCTASFGTAGCAESARTSRHGRLCGNSGDRSVAETRSCRRPYLRAGAPETLEQQGPVFLKPRIVRIDEELLLDERERGRPLRSGFRGSSGSGKRFGEGGPEHRQVAMPAGERVLAGDERRHESNRRLERVAPRFSLSERQARGAGLPPEHREIPCADRFLRRRRVPGVRRGSQCPRLVQKRQRTVGAAAGQRHVTLSLEGDGQFPRGIAAARVACEPLPPQLDRPVEERPGAADVVELQHRVAQTLERNRQVAAVVDAGLVARADPLEEHQRALEVGNGPGPVAGHGGLHLRLPRQRVSEVA